MLLRVGRMIAGYFGDRGLPEGESGPLGLRSLGAMVDGDLVAVGPPSLGLSNPSYRRHSDQNAFRQTFMVNGGNDGLLHFFRMRDGFEVLNFIPRETWKLLSTASSSVPLNGPLSVAEVMECRSFVNARPGCPTAADELKFRTLVTGGIGKGGGNLFGVDVTGLGALLDENNATVLSLAATFSGANADRPYMWDVTIAQEAQLGRSISRPVLAQVQVGDEVRAASIVGCGDDVVRPDIDNRNGPGRCVLVLDAVTGTIIHTFKDAKMDSPMVGSPTVWPGTTAAPIERLYIGDRKGRLWRADMRSTNTSEWSISIIFPFGEQPLNQGYVQGRALTGRPMVKAQADGNVAIVFGTGDLNVPEVLTPAYAVSLYDGPAVDPNNPNETRLKTGVNWVMKLGRLEFVSGEPAIFDETMLFTTIQDEQVDACSSALGRIYGVHYREARRDANGGLDPIEVPDGRQIPVKPMLPQVAADGTPQPNALAFRFPRGRIAFGVSLAQLPTCEPGESGGTEMVVNLSDDSRGGRGAINPGEMGVERVQNGRLSPGSFDNSVFARANRTELSIGLGTDKTGNGSRRGTASKRSPFRASVSYWGSTVPD